MNAEEHQREYERAIEAGRNAGRTGKGANDNPWRNSATLRQMAEAWEEGRLEGKADRGTRR